jgi:flagellar M-ring protein FliF
MLQKINAIWQRIGLVQRAVLAAAVIACMLTAGLLTHWAAKPEMRLLYGSLSPEQASEIADKVSQKNVTCKLGPGGTSVYVPAENVYPLRAALAKEGLSPKDGEPGYEIFDNEKLGVSPLVQKMNYTRALQGELAKTIQCFEGVEYARIHIVRPDQTMFTGDGKTASAAVMLKLKPGWRLSSATATSITNLVAGAVEGLKPDQVTIADSQGNLMNGSAPADTLVAGANTYKDYKTAVEQQMTDRLLRSLETVLGPGKATVLTSAVIDMTSESVVSTTYEKGIPIEETEDTKSNIKPGAASADGKETSPGTTEKTGSTISKYKVPETITTKQSSPGKITAWSISIVADLSKSKIAAATEEKGTKKEGEQQTPAGGGEELVMSVDDVKSMIRTAIGSELLKEENLTVRHVPFNRPAEEAVPEAAGFEKWSRYIEIARQSSMGILAVSALLALKIFTGASRKAAAATVTQPPAANTLGSGVVPMLGAGGTDTNSIRQHIAVQLRQNPDQVRQIFTSWLSEER